MPTITGQQIIDRAETILQDATNIRWTEAESLGWLNEGQREIALIRPDASVVNGNITMVLGTKQGLPASGLRLIDVVRNMGADGATPGNAVRLVEREVLDAQRPGWHAESSAASVKHFVFDARDPKTFYVYPPAQANIKIECIYSVSPAEVAAIGNVITLDDIYANALTDWILYRNWLKDAEYTSNFERANAHKAAFLASLGAKTTVDIASSPNKNAPPFNPNTSGGMK